MTTKIIITPANHGSFKTHSAGIARTVRVVTVGGTSTKPHNKTSVVTLPISSPMIKSASNLGTRSEIRTVVKRIFTNIRSSNTLPTVSSQSAPRKRQRLDHLTSDQKNQRRKLKNRVAAQTARDRKKMQMDLLESRVSSLERQNNKLVEQNTFLQKQNELLSTQNSLLQERLQHQPEPQPTTQQRSAAAATCDTSIESAEGTGSSGGSTAGAESDQLGQLPGGAGDGRSTHADLLELLTETLFGSEQTSEGDAPCADSAVVGTATEELEPGHDTLTSDVTDLNAELDSAAYTTYTASDELLVQLMRESDEAAVPGSLPPSPSSPSPPSSPVKIKPEIVDDWDMFEVDEPLDSHFEDQFLLFPQLVL